MSASPVNPGDILVGRFRVDRVLGMGNMGIVVAATQIHLEQRVALKFMLATRNASPGLNERFLREARAAAALKTEHIARVSEFGYLESGAPYMVMEYLDGQDLSAVLQQRGPLPIPEAVDYILQACEAVGEAHAIGIIHRDIKPANLFLTGMGKRPCIKVLDFGISKFAEGEHALTKTGEAMGSPLYMSREQMNSSKDVDGRTDIWSLTCTLYELLAGAGNTPFSAETLPKLCTRVCLDEPTPLVTFRPDAPSALWAVLVQGVEKERERRYSNVAEFAAALAPFGSSRAAMYVDRIAMALGEAIAPARPTDLLPPEPSPQMAQAPFAATPSAVAGAAPAVATTGSALIRPAAAAAKRQRRGALVAGVSAALVVLVVGAVGVMRWRSDPAGAVPSAVPGTTAERPLVPAPAASPAERSPSPLADDAPSVLPALGPTATAAASAMISPAAKPVQKGATPASTPVVKVPGPTPRPASPSGDFYNR